MLRDEVACELERMVRTCASPITPHTVAAMLPSFFTANGRQFLDALLSRTEGACALQRISGGLDEHMQQLLHELSGAGVLRPAGTPSKLRCVP